MPRPKHNVETIKMDVDNYNIASLEDALLKLEKHMQPRQITAAKEYCVGDKTKSEALAKAGYAVAKDKVSRQWSRICRSEAFTLFLELLERKYSLEYGVSAGRIRAVLLEIAENKKERSNVRVSAANSLIKLEGYDRDEAKETNVTIVSPVPSQAGHPMGGDTCVQINAASSTTYDA